jgi:hypothetical protein
MDSVANLSSICTGAKICGKLEGFGKQRMFIKGNLQINANFASVNVAISGVYTSSVIGKNASNSKMYLPWLLVRYEKK